MKILNILVFILFTISSYSQFLDNSGILFSQKNTDEFWRTSKDSYDKYIILNQFSTSINYTGDITSDGEYIWIADGFNSIIKKLDMINGAVIQTISVPLNNLGGIAFNNGYIWAAESYNYKDFRVILKLNALTGDVVDTVTHSLGDFTHGMQFVNDSLYVNMFYSGSIDTTFILDTIGNVIDKFPNGFNFSHGITSNKSNILISANNLSSGSYAQIISFDLTSHSEIEAINCPGGDYPNGLVWIDNYLWVANSETDYLYKIALLDSPVQYIEACDSYMSPSGNYVWSNSGAYVDTLVSSSGNDSIIGIYLTINHSNYSEFSISSCEAYSVPSGDETYFVSGVYNDTILNEFGCENYLTLDVTINYNSFASVSPTTCEYYHSPSGKMFYETGRYMDTIPNDMGCDSIITIDLTVLNSFNTIEVNACMQYEVPSGDEIYYENGTYIDTVSNIFGCDSIITIKLEIFNIDTSITISNNTLIVSETDAGYQWIDCDSGVEIQGETNQSFIPIVSGNYSVEVEKYGCLVNSSCIDFLITNIHYESDDYIQIFPNPIKDKLVVECDIHINKIEIISVNGTKIFESESLYGYSHEIDMKDLNAGIYFIKITSDSRILLEKIIKE